jgi:hypothetical protein
MGHFFNRQSKFFIELFFCVQTNVCSGRPHLRRSAWPCAVQLSGLTSPPPTAKLSEPSLLAQEWAIILCASKARTTVFAGHPCGISFPARAKHWPRVALCILTPRPSAIMLSSRILHLSIQFACVQRRVQLIVCSISDGLL